MGCVAAQGNRHQHGPMNSASQLVGGVDVDGACLPTHGAAPLAARVLHHTSGCTGQAAATCSQAAATCSQAAAERCQQHNPVPRATLRVPEYS
jgi:hypothetical protein